MESTLVHFVCGDVARLHRYDEIIDSIFIVVDNVFVVVDDNDVVAVVFAV